MPTLKNKLEIEVPPDRFLRACSDIELVELWLLIQTRPFMDRIEYAMDRQHPEEVQGPKPYPLPNH